MNALVDIQDILKERQTTHGNYEDHAQFTQGIKAVIRNSPRVLRMSPAQVEALEMIAHKIGRILAGNPHFEDHWRDIAGYATLVADLLLEGEQP